MPSVVLLPPREETRVPVETVCAYGCQSPIPAMAPMVEGGVLAMDCSHTVTFSIPRYDLCWAHEPGCSCTSGHHSCDRPGIGRLGLCPLHERGILGKAA